MLGPVKSLLRRPYGTGAHSFLSCFHPRLPLGLQEGFNVAAAKPYHFWTWLKLFELPGVDHPLDVARRTVQVSGELIFAEQCRARNFAKRYRFFFFAICRHTHSSSVLPACWLQVRNTCLDLRTFAFIDQSRT